MKKLVYYDGIGEVLIKQDKRIKRLRISIKPLQPINVGIPYGTSKETLSNFISGNKKWILENKKKIEGKENQQTFFKPETVFKTKYRELKLLPILKTGTIQTELKKQTIIIRYPETADIYQGSFQKTVRVAVEECLRLEAKQYLPYRTVQLANAHNLSVNKVSVRIAKTRWGSCSAHNNISLNVHLMRLPDELIDYVILHELAHIRHRNHGKEFWYFLESICPDCRKKNRALNKYSPVIW